MLLFHVQQIADRQNAGELLCTPKPRNCCWWPFEESFGTEHQGASSQRFTHSHFKSKLRRWALYWLCVNCGLPFCPENLSPYVSTSVHFVHFFHIQFCFRNHIIYTKNNFSCHLTLVIIGIFDATSHNYNLRYSL